MPENQNVYTVAYLNRYVKNMISQDYFLQSFSVKGEVSNCKGRNSSGHIYFTLKDETAAVSCAIWNFSVERLHVLPQNGQQVVVRAKASFYEASGGFTLVVTQVELQGNGVLFERYEQLKQELLERGMFDASYKKPIPKYVKRLGVVTAATGAAVRDIINVSKRRNPFIQIFLYPALVQGDGAKESIVRGIRALERTGVDCMIVGRGGGSIEELWAFNEEVVAQAIFDCSVPIISAVGHETDTTIADYVADKRASTPSVAAEFAVVDISSTLDTLSSSGDRLRRAMKQRLLLSRERATRFGQVLQGRSPGRIIDGYYQRASHLGDLLQRDMLSILSEKKRILTISGNRLTAANPTKRLKGYHDLSENDRRRLKTAFERILSDRRAKMAVLVERLDGSSPLKKLKSGFSYVSDETGANVRSVKGLTPGRSLTIQMSDGFAKTKIEEVHPNA